VVTGGVATWKLDGEIAPGYDQMSQHATTPCRSFFLEQSLFKFEPEHIAKDFNTLKL